MKKNRGKNNDHAHYTAAQKLCYRLDLSKLRGMLKDAQMEVTSLCDLPWFHLVETHSVDDKCGVDVSKPDCPVVATSHSKTKAILPANTEVHGSVHDYSCYKATPSLSARLHIEEKPTESLFSGGKEGLGKIFVSVHDAIFEKSNCFNHNAVSLHITR